MVKCWNENYLLTCLKDNKKVYPKRLLYNIAKMYLKYKEYIESQELKHHIDTVKKLDKIFDVNTIGQEFTKKQLKEYECIK